MRDGANGQPGSASEDGATARRLAANVPKVAVFRFFFSTHLFAAVLVPFFRDFGGLGFTAILLVQAWFQVWSFVLEVPTGAVADRFGRRVSLAAAGLVAALGFGVYASVPSLAVFLVGEVLVAVAMTLASGADEALVYDSLERIGRAAEATRAMSRLQAWQLAGFLAGALAGALLASRAGVRAPMLFQFVPALAAAAVALSLAEPGARAGRPRVGASYAAVFRDGVRHLARTPVLRALALDQAANASVVWLVVWLYQAQLQRAGVPLAAFGVVHAAMTLAQIALLARVADAQRLLGGPRRLMRLTAIAPPLCIAALAATARPVPSVLLIIVAASLGFARIPLFSGPMNRHIPSEHRATVLSAVSALRTAGIALLYPLFGWLVDRSLPVALLVLGAVGTAVAALAAAPANALDGRAGEDQAALG